MNKTVIFPGSFSPFTKGHQSVVDRALPLFDKIIIAIGINSEKNQYFSIEERMDWIEAVYEKNPNVLENYTVYNLGYTYSDIGISKYLKTNLKTKL